MTANRCTFDVLAGTGFGTALDAAAYDRYREQLNAMAYANITDKPISYEDFMAGTYYAADKAVTADLIAYLAATNGTFAHASGGTMLNSTGNLIEFAANAPRITDRGLLLEGTDTNLVRNPRCEGAVVGSPGTLPTYWSGLSSFNGLSRQIVGTGVENGIPYTDIRFYGTPGGDINNQPVLVEGASTIPAALGDVITWSVYAKIIAGDKTGVTALYFNISEKNSSLAQVAWSTAQNIPSTGDFSGNRIGGTYTCANASVAYMDFPLSLKASAGVAVDFTIRVGAPQFVKAAFASSIILPPVGSPAQATRVSDNLYWTRASPVTLMTKLIRARTANGIGSTAQILWRITEAGSDSNLINVTRDIDRTMRLQVVVSNVMVANLNLGMIADGTDFAIAFRATGNDFAASINGGAVVTNTSVAMPAGLVTERFGRFSGSGYNWYGTIRSAAEFPTLLSNPKLQALTA